MLHVAYFYVTRDWFERNPGHKNFTLKEAQKFWLWQSAGKNNNNQKFIS